MTKRSPTKSSSNDRTGYNVGYKRPPLHTRFKPGRSGNPKGRPRGHKNLATLIKEAANEKVTLRIGGRVRQVTKAQAFVIKNFNDALASDEKAARVLMLMMREARLFEQESAPDNQSRLSEHDELVYRDHIRRLTVDDHTNSAKKKRGRSQ